MMNSNIKNTLDDIPQSEPGAKKITALVRKDREVIGYKLSDNSVVKKQDAIAMARNGEIHGVGIAHKGDTEYLKSIPNGKESDNLGNLPSITE